MMCCQRRRRRLSCTKPDRVISGTWDFKWIPGTKIRVAFQELPDDVTFPNGPFDFERAVALVKEKLASWFQSRANLSYEVIEEPLPPPPRREGPGMRTSKSVSTSHSIIEYDALISFLPLPVLIPATEQHDEVVVYTSSSELGRYAEWVDYGVPTSYLGPPAGHQGDWLQDDIGIFTIAHELGHVLGLAHEQQNPLLKGLKWQLEYRPMEEMIERVKVKGGLAPGASIPDFIHSEVTDPWPGELAFSDWRTHPDEHVRPGHVNLHSVMAKPSFVCLLKGGHGGKNCDSTESICSFERTALQALKEPTASDLKQLEEMYGTSKSPPR